MSAMADSFTMKKDAWRARLVEAIEHSGKSARAISTEAGLGPGYVHSIIKEGKDPTVERLLSVCDAVPVSLIYVMYGVDAEPDDLLNRASLLITPLVGHLISYSAPARLIRWCLKSFDMDTISKVEGTVLLAVCLAKVERGEM